MTTDEKKTRKFSRGKLKYSINENFFNKWNPQMAYVLGFTFADGNIHRTSISWDIQTRDINLLRKLKLVFNATYPIKIQRRTSCRLRISNQIFVNGAISKGLLPKKNIRNTLPNIPDDLIRHFVRGYLDGDGWLIIRNRPNHNREVDLGFSSGNKEFLQNITKIIYRKVGIGITGGVRKRLKLTPHKITSVTYMIEYYTVKAMSIAKWLYENLSNDDLYLDRKYKKYLIVKKYYQFIESGSSKLYRITQKKFGKSMYEILKDLYISKRYTGQRIAQVLNVHSSSIYRWLAKTGIKYPEKRMIHG